MRAAFVIRATTSLFVWVVLAACGSTRSNESSARGVAGSADASSATAGRGGAGSSSQGGCGPAESGTAGMSDGGGGAAAGGGTPVGGAVGHSGAAGTAGVGGGVAGSGGGAAGSPPFVDPYMGSSGCPDGGFDIGRGACALSMPLSGGLSTLLKSPENVGCGHGDLSNLSFSPVSNLHETWLHFSKPLVRGVTNEALPASVEIRVKTQSGDWRIWTTPADSCSVTLTSNVCWYFEISDAYYLVSGTGTCSKPADAQAPASDAPVVVGDFWFATLIYP